MSFSRIYIQIDALQIVCVEVGFIVFKSKKPKKNMLVFNKKMF